MRAILRAAARTATAAAQATVAVSRAVANVVYSPTMQEKAKQGATEITNALYANQSNAYSPVTADKAADNAARRSSVYGHGQYASPDPAHRAQFQKQDQARGIDR